jgi:hypothetical protein
VPIDVECEIEAAGRPIAPGGRPPGRPGKPGIRPGSMDPMIGSAIGTMISALATKIETNKKNFVIQISESRHKSFSLFASIII